MNPNLEKQLNSSSQVAHVFNYNPIQQGLKRKIVSALFPDLLDAVLQLRQDRLLYAINAWAPGAEFSDDYLADKLRAAEAEAERKLRVFLGPVEIIPQGSSEDTAALDTAGIRWIEEPGYDFEPAMFTTDCWGLIETRQRPIISISEIQFAYPAPGQGVLYRVPSTWRRVDKKYGRLNLVPTQDMMSLPLNAFLLSVLGGGRHIPLMLQIRYRAGLENPARDYPDLVDLVKKMAIASLLSDLFLPTSASISADGLSQSKGFDLDKIGAMIDKKTDTLRQAIHGVSMVVV